MHSSGIASLIVILLIIFGGFWLVNHLKLDRNQIPYPTNYVANPSYSYQYETTPIASTKVYSHYSLPPRTTYTVVPNQNTDQGGCYVSGCSGQICSSNPDVASTCEYRTEYACYQGARCERQSNGACGWTQTSELNYCLNNS